MAMDEQTRQDQETMDRGSKPGTLAALAAALLLTLLAAGFVYWVYAGAEEEVVVAGQQQQAGAATTRETGMNAADNKGGTGLAMSPLRVQTMRGFDYLYVSKQTTMPQLGQTIGELMGRFDAAKKQAKAVPTGPVLFIYRDGGPAGFTLEIGQPVESGTNPAGEAQIRKVAASKCASVIYTGGMAGMPAAAQELGRQAKEAGLRDPVEYREWYLHFEGDQSPNNVTMLQNILEFVPAGDKSTASPEYQIGEVREQTMGGMDYFYVEAQTTHDRIPDTFGQLDKLFREAAQGAGLLVGGPQCARYLDAVPGQPFMLQTGQMVGPGTAAVAQAKVLTLPPFRCATSIYCGSLAHMGEAIGELTSTMQQRGLELGAEYRELYLYWEGPDSANNVMLLQFQIR